MRSEFVSVHDYADQLAADSWGDGFETAHSASLLEWAEGLGVCFLQGQQLELAVVGLAVELKLVAESASCRKTIGQLLGLIKPSISADDFQVLDRAVKVRNRFVHGSLWIGLSELRMRGWWEEIGVDLWSYRDENCLVEQRAHGRRESGTEYLELWIRELASATRRAVELQTGLAPKETE